MNQDSPFRWRPLRQEEARIAWALHAQVFAATPVGMVRPDQPGHFEQHIQALGRILGCFIGDQLVAYGVLGMRSETVAHLAELLALAPADRARACVLDGAASLPPWRGHNLHQAAIDARGELARSLGRTLVLATVAPENMRSLRGLLLQGYAVHGYATVYGGLPRLLMARDLLRPQKEWRLTRQVPAADHAGHQSALAGGLRGYGCQQDAAKAWHISYGEAQPIA
ncbi:hypothetical protein H3H37_15455 [Duganella sp. LX20W]|uniref:N-acetyltransferase domain-containing protein n=1 Tax=Rugamonas brunnea TaxID=2758569 RepID=A0A7W2ETV6_9BURK|nr:hypothetical protein [Rugamonas brunnea]MBA5638455.1 hypothetical protein [Rugamonas brunnea]